MQTQTTQVAEFFINQKNNNNNKKEKNTSFTFGFDGLHSFTTFNFVLFIGIIIVEKNKSISRVKNLSSQNERN